MCTRLSLELLMISILPHWYGLPNELPDQQPGADGDEDAREALHVRWSSDKHREEERDHDTGFSVVGTAREGGAPGQVRNCVEVPQYGRDGVASGTGGKQGHGVRQRARDKRVNHNAHTE